MTRYDRPAHPATKVMAFIAFLIGLGIVMEGYNQAHSYLSGPKTTASAAVSTTDGRADKDQ